MRRIESPHQCRGVSMSRRRVARPTRKIIADGVDGVQAMLGHMEQFVSNVTPVDEQTARAKAGPAWQGSKLVFTTRYGTPVEPRNFLRSWDARRIKAGVRKITVHDARRTCGSLLADLDVNPRVAMQILRHAQFSLTMEIYTVASSKAHP